MNTSKPNFKLIIGLGNPDAKYQNTYHNVGALFADYFKKYRNSKSLINAKLAILASTTYVNDSGKFVLKMMKKDNVKTEELLVVHDDSDITIGNYKLSFDIGAAGHHGIESIQQHLKTNKFWRLRIGIRSQDEKIRQKAGEFVLKKISADDNKILESIFLKIISELES